MPNGFIYFLAFVSLCFALDSEYLNSRQCFTLPYIRNKDLKTQLSIPGRIIKWYVKRRCSKKGDTILQISEIKDDYLDPLLVERTQEQVQAKRCQREYYNAKISTTEKPNYSHYLPLNDLKIKLKLKLLSYKIN